MVKEGKHVALALSGRLFTTELSGVCFVCSIQCLSNELLWMRVSLSLDWWVVFAQTAPV